MKYLKPYNESIKHLLKPKSEEDIMEITKGLSPLNKIKKGIKHDFDYLFKKGVDELPNREYSFTDILYDLFSKNNTEKIEYIFNNVKKLRVQDVKKITDLIKNRLYIQKDQGLRLRNEKMFKLFKDKLESMVKTDYNELMEVGVQYDNYDNVVNAVENGVTIKDKHIWTSVRNNNIEMTKFLLENIKTPYKENWHPNPVSTSIDLNNLEMFKLLISHNIKFDIDNIQIGNIIDHIENNRNHEIIEYLSNNYPKVKKSIIKHINELDDSIKKFKKYE